MDKEAISIRNIGILAFTSKKIRLFYLLIGPYICAVARPVNLLATSSGLSCSYSYSSL